MREHMQGGTHKAAHSPAHVLHKVAQCVTITHARTHAGWRSQGCTRPSTLKCTCFTQPCTSASRAAPMMSHAALHTLHTSHSAMQEHMHSGAHNVELSSARVQLNMLHSAVHTCRVAVAMSHSALHPHAKISKVQHCAAPQHTDACMDSPCLSMLTLSRISG